MEEKQVYESICAQCGKPFVKQKFNQVFCSKDCRLKHKYETNKEFILSAKRLRYGKSYENRVKTICDKTQCKLYNDKYFNHCAALHDIDFQGKSCPFFK